MAELTTDDGSTASPEAIRHFEERNNAMSDQTTDHLSEAVEAPAMRLVRGFRYARPRYRGIARLKALYWYAIRGYDSEVCQSCGNRVGLAWLAEIEDWRAVMSRPGDDGILCIHCFDGACDKQGKFVRWRPEVLDRERFAGSTPALSLEEAVSSLVAERDRTANPVGCLTGHPAASSSSLPGAVAAAARDLWNRAGDRGEDTFDEAAPGETDTYLAIAREVIETPAVATYYEDKGAEKLEVVEAERESIRSHLKVALRERNDLVAAEDKGTEKLKSVEAERDTDRKVERERLREIAEFIDCVLGESIGAQFPGHSTSANFLRKLASQGEERDES